MPAEQRIPPEAFASDEPFERFTDVAPELGLDLADQAGGVIVDDFSGDGNLGLVISSIGNHDQLRYFQSRGDGSFEDRAAAAGIDALLYTMGMNVADLDNDGDQDVYEDMGGAYDGDWYPNVLYENPGHGRHWATLRLKGPGANPAGIGARLRVRLATPAGPRSLYRLVGSGGSFGANSLQVELGLADATAIEEIGVTWPGAPAEETFSGAGLDGIWQLSAGSGRAVKVTQAAFVLGGGAPVAH